jgi:NADH-quinone oxidoreductase subunit C
MTPAEILTALHAAHPDIAVHADGIDPDAVVPAEGIVAVAVTLRDTFAFAILNDVCFVDYLETDAKKLAKAGFEPHLEIVYHLSSFQFPGRRLKLKVVLPRSGPAEVPTVSGVWPGAAWHEREAFDLGGVSFTGHPDPRRILLADDWIGHPLRKDYEFPLEYNGIRCR